MLEVHGLTKYFGGLAALSDVGLEVHEGEILGLIGPNGAGKSTLFNVVAGVYRPNTGRVVFKGEDITGLKPHVIAGKGLIRTFQVFGIWPECSVIENIRIASHRTSGISVLGAILNTPSVRRKERFIDEQALEVMSWVGMDHLRDQEAGTLSHGYQKTLSLAIALTSRPPLLLLDEPVTDLSGERVATILDLLKQTRDAGSTVILIEHNMRAIFNICDRIVALSAGEKIADGTPTEVRENQDVITAYLGTRTETADAS
jgi:branched-chain amino acid transport system ATP-binding protein